MGKRASTFSVRREEHEAKVKSIIKSSSIFFILITFYAGLGYSDTGRTE